MDQNEFLGHYQAKMERLLMVSVRERFALIFALELLPDSKVAELNLEGKPRTVATNLLASVHRYGTNRGVLNELMQRIDDAELPEGIPSIESTT